MLGFRVVLFLKHTGTSSCLFTCLGTWFLSFMDFPIWYQLCG